MCNVYPMLYEKRGDEGWKLVWSDENAYQMDAGHLLYPGNDRLVMTLNPPKARYPKEQRTFLVPCTPVAYLFDISDGVKLIDIREIPWDKPDYPFKSHSYRSSCVDIVSGNLFFTKLKKSMSPGKSRIKYWSAQGSFPTVCLAIRPITAHRRMTAWRSIGQKASWIACLL